jgi:hypothetical protein
MSMTKPAAHLRAARHEGQIVGLASRGEIRDDFETAVMESIVGSGGAGTN